MSTFVKLAIATALVTATAGLAQAQQGRSIEVLPAQNFAQVPAQDLAQAPVAQAPATEAPAEAAEQPGIAPAPQAAPVQTIAPAQRVVAQPRGEPVRPAYQPVEKCHADKPVYGHSAPRYQEQRYYAPPRYERHSYNDGAYYRRGY